jgi:hypothetical protein
VSIKAYVGERFVGYGIRLYDGWMLFPDDIPIVSIDKNNRI